VLVLVGGRADLSRDGRKFAELGPGDLVGELEAISRMPAPATVTTTAPTRVLAIWDAEFRELLRNHPAIAAAVLEAVASRQARAA
jgi:CRP-like cAMP-binding protein